MAFDGIQNFLSSVEGVLAALAAVIGGLIAIWKAIAKRETSADPNQAVTAPVVINIENTQFTVPETFPGTKGEPPSKTFILPNTTDVGQAVEKFPNYTPPPKLTKGIIPEIIGYYDLVEGKKIRFKTYNDGIIKWIMASLTIIMAYGVAVLLTHTGTNEVFAAIVMTPVAIYRLYFGNYIEIDSVYNKTTYALALFKWTYPKLPKSTLYVKEKGDMYLCALQLDGDFILDPRDIDKKELEQIQKFYVSLRWFLREPVQVAKGHLITRED